MIRGGRWVRPQPGQEPYSELGRRGRMLLLVDERLVFGGVQLGLFYRPDGGKKEREGETNDQERRRRTVLRIQPLPRKRPEHGRSGDSHAEIREDAPCEPDVRLIVHIKKTRESYARQPEAPMDGSFG